MYRLRVFLVYLIKVILDIIMVISFILAVSKGNIEMMIFVITYFGFSGILVFIVVMLVVGIKKSGTIDRVETSKGVFSFLHLKADVAHKPLKEKEVLMLEINYVSPALYRDKILKEYDIDILANDSSYQGVVNNGNNQENI